MLLLFVVVAFDVVVVVAFDVVVVVVVDAVAVFGGELLLFL